MGGCGRKDVGVIYKLVAQAVIMFGLETWIINPRIIRILRFFHHQVTRRLKGKQSYRGVDRICRYPPLSEAMAYVWLYEVNN